MSIAVVFPPRSLRNLAIALFCALVVALPAAGAAAQESDGTDYDTDDDGLIEISTLAQLDAVRHDLDGDGTPTDDGSAAYAQAFPGAVEQMGCSGADGCVGYELTANLDFDTNASGAADAGDAYWNNGAGWTPIGGAGSVEDSHRNFLIMRNPLLAIFEGNGHTVANLFIDTIRPLLGLFGYTGSDSTTGAVGTIRNLGLIDIDVAGRNYVGGLVGNNGGVITNSSVTGRVSMKPAQERAGKRLAQSGDFMGGLIGLNQGAITTSHSSARISGQDYVGGLVGENEGAITASHATGHVLGEDTVGGLVGDNYGTITASHATGPVSADDLVGGLAGSNMGAITASHATGRVSPGESSKFTHQVGGLVGDNRGSITGSYATGPVSGDDVVGGLVGQNDFDPYGQQLTGASGQILRSYATGRVSGGSGAGGLVGINGMNCRIIASYAAGPVSGDDKVGGLVGRLGGKILASYATGSVSGDDKVGGLVGISAGDITASYATGAVWGADEVGGLAGVNPRASRINTSYWDTRTSRHASGTHGEGQATQALQAPTGSSGIYEYWKLDLDGDSVLEAPWDFGSASQYPVLAVDLDGNGQSTWQEFGYQLRAGPSLTATVAVSPDQVALSWTAVDASHWSPAPAVTYTIYRDDGATVEAVAQDLDGLSYSDTDLTLATSYAYQVTAGVGGSESVRSGWVTIETVSRSDQPTPVLPPANTAATGAPTISGPAQVGETLTASTSDIADADGLDNVEFAYQWLADDAEIAGAAAASYTLPAADLGKSIKVRVSFSDDRANDEALTSAPTEPVTVRIWAATLTAGGSGTYRGYSPAEQIGALSDDEFTLGAIDYGVTRVTEADAGKLSLVLDGPLLAPFILRVGTVGFASEDATSEEGDGATTYRWDKGPVDWTAGDEVELSLALSDVPLFAVVTGVPTSHDGQTVFIFELLLSRAPQADFSYRTLRDHAFTVTGGTVVRTPRQAPPSNMSWHVHVKPASDADVTVVLPVTEHCALLGAVCSDDARRLSNRVEVTVAGPQSADANTAATGAPTISGTVQAGETFNANTTGIADADGLDGVAYSYQWLADDAEIAGATAASYTLTDGEVGKAMKVRVSFTDNAGHAESLTSAATVAVAARPNNPATGAPTISGTVQAGATLTASTSGIADADGMAGVAYSYQWLADDAEIAGATAPSYTLTDAEVGKAISVRVSFSDNAGHAQSLTSAATATVAARPNNPATGAPTISGTVQAGATLNASTSGIADADGLDGVAYSYQWLADDAEIAGATAPSYTLTDAEVGKAMKVRVSFTDEAGHAESLTSAATAAVTARPNNPATGAPTISGAVQAGETLTANTSGIADADGLAGVTYSYQWLAADADIAGATGASYTLTDAAVGKAIKVRVSFTDEAGHAESLTSAATDTVAARPDPPVSDTPPPGASTAVDVTVGEVVAGDIAAMHEVDWFRVSLLASESYQIDMRGEWGGEWAKVDGKIVWLAAGTLEDPKLLGVYSAANALVSGTDKEVSGYDWGNDAEGKNSRITAFSPPSDGAYYIAAGSEQGGWTGTYELTVTVVADG